MAGSAVLDRVHRDVASSGVLTAFRTFSFLGLFAGLSLTSAYAQAPSEPMVYEGVIGGPKLIEEGQPPVWIHATVEDAERLRPGNARRGSRGAASSLSDLSYRGGIGGTGVETLPKVYLVLWGSQWNSNDPNGEASILEDFFNGVGASSWLNSVTQYCQGVATGAVFCNGAGQAAGNPAAIFGGVWSDSASAAPTHPRQSQLASEAVRAAAHFGNNSASSNVSTQYVIATATRNSSNGFGVQYCAWHSSTNSSYGKIAYTNLPYITDAGASCGANFNGLGPEAGITIVGGHELAETITDQFPSGGWLDSSGAENGDKCAWISAGQGAAQKISLSTGTFPVQSLWSNASGGCVISY
jgi:serine protease